MFTTLDRIARLTTTVAAGALLATALAPALGAQPSPTTKPAARPAAKPVATSVAMPVATPAAQPDSLRVDGTADDTGFREGHLYMGPRVWAGMYGTIAVGVHGEKAIGGPRSELGNGRIGVGASIDMYSYSDGAFGYRWSYRVIPVTGFVNYHVTLKESKLDPYAGIGLGYYMVSTSVDGVNTSASSARGSALFLGVQLGARYFVKPNFAVQAQTGVGLGALSLGVTWKR